MKNILVTGANGFVGQALCRALDQKGYVVRGAFRDASKFFKASAKMACVAVGDINEKTDWSAAIQGIDCVVHLAGRVHMMREDVAEPLVAYRKTNVGGLKRLLDFVKRAGVPRLIYLSTIKVNGERTTDKAFSEDDPVAPEDAYAQSKWEAEQILLARAHETGLKVIILRIPLVYGPGVKANFFNLLQWVDRGLYLPFGAVKNQRSFLFLGNLVDAIIRSIDAPAFSREVFLLSDGEDVSTPELLRRVAHALGRPSRLLAVPIFFLDGIGVMGDFIEKFTGKNVSVDSKKLSRLTDSLCVNSTKFKQVAAWQPPYQMTEGLAITAQWYSGAKDTIMGTRVKSKRKESG